MEFTYEFVPSHRLMVSSEDSGNFAWYARVYIVKNGLASAWWTQPCSTRRGARRLAKKQARKFRKAADRGEFVY